MSRAISLDLTIQVLLFIHLTQGYRCLSLANVPHRRVKRSGMKDMEIVPDYQLPEHKIPLGETHYSIYRKRLAWKQAHDVCETYEGQMASFITKDLAEKAIEEIFHHSKFTEDYDWGKVTEEFGLDRRYWIGLSDLFSDGHWSWVGKGAPLIYNSMWYPGQPDAIWPNGSIRSGRNQHCASLWNPVYFKVDGEGNPTERHTFDDLECDRELYFICELDQAKLDARKEALMAAG